MNSTAEGAPAFFDSLPASEYDFTPIHKLTFLLSPGAAVFGNKGYISADDAPTTIEETEGCLVSVRRQTHRWMILIFAYIANASTLFILS